MDRNYDVIVLILKYIYFKEAWGSQFVDMIKIEITFNSMTFKRITSYVLRCKLYLYFLIQQKLLISGENFWCQQNLRIVSRNLYIFFRSPLVTV